MGDDIDKPRVAIAGAAVDLLAGSVGLLAAAVADAGSGEGRSERRGNWAEVTGVAAHDVLACRSLRLAEQAGSDVLDVFLAWMESVVRCRQRDRIGGALELYELGFELPTRAAAVLSTQDLVGADAFVSVGRLLGGAYAHGDERRLQEGKRSRLGLDLSETDAVGLRVAWDPRVARPEDGWGSRLRRGWSSAIETMRPAVGSSSAAVLTSFFEAGLDTRAYTSPAPAYGGGA